MNASLEKIKRGILPNLLEEAIDGGIMFAGSAALGAASAYKGEDAKVFGVHYDLIAGVGGAIVASVAGCLAPKSIVTRGAQLTSRIGLGAMGHTFGAKWGAEKRGGGRHAAAAAATLPSGQKVKGLPGAGAGVNLTPADFAAMTSRG